MSILSDEILIVFHHAVEKRGVGSIDDIVREINHEVEISLIKYVLKECGGNKSKAAKFLGISRVTLKKKLDDAE